VQAFVQIELQPEALLCVGDPFQGSERKLELTIALRADTDSGNGFEPFDDPKIAFLHRLTAMSNCAHLGQKMPV
jgi:hypothetical protein